MESKNQNLAENNFVYPSLVEKLPDLARLAAQNSNINGLPLPKWLSDKLLAIEFPVLKEAEEIAKKGTVTLDLYREGSLGTWKVTLSELEAGWFFLSAEEFLTYGGTFADNLYDELEELLAGNGPAERYFKKEVK